ncbi:MAG: hypothetical protein ACREV3_02720 [Gammaproteobacteria bacterium]
MSESITPAKRCHACGCLFQPRAGWEWLCYPCWRLRRDLDLEHQNARLRQRLREMEREAMRRATYSEHDLSAELRDQLPRLIHLVHPDKHGNSAAANEMTAWLLSLRGRAQ